MKYVTLDVQLQYIFSLEIYLKIIKQFKYLYGIIKHLKDQNNTLIFHVMLWKCMLMRLID
jgi:hypothetical protein